MTPALTDDDFDGYFRGGSWSCAACGHTESLWSLIRAQLTPEDPFRIGLVALGAVGTFGSVQLVRDQVLHVDLATFGVPPDAEVLSIHLTPTGSAGGALTPCLLISSIERRRPAHQFNLYPMPLGSGADANEVSLLCMWLPGTHDAALDSLVTAMLAFADGAHREVIVPANVTVEDVLGRVLSEFFEARGGNNVRAFLGAGAASYGYQLDPLLPVLMSMTSAPPLPEPVMQGLKALRKQRNRVAHEQRPEVTCSDAASAVCSALFGYRYLALYARELGR